MVSFAMYLGNRHDFGFVSLSRHVHGEAALTLVQRELHVAADSHAPRPVCVERCKLVYRMGQCSIVDQRH